LGDEPEFTRHPLYILVDILVFIWEAVWTLLEIFAGILQMLAGH
jgi:hypothetical protein